MIYGCETVVHRKVIAIPWQDMIAQYLQYQNTSYVYVRRT